MGHGSPSQQQLFAFADASDVATCIVIYIRTVTSDDSVHVAFVAGKSKLLKKDNRVKGQLSIPRPEMTSAYDLANRIL